MNYGGYIIKEMIGKGGSGTVYRCIDEKTQENAIAKIIKKESLKKRGDVDKIKRGLYIPGLISEESKNIVKVINFVETRNNILIIYEYIKNSTDLFRKKFDFQRDFVTILHVMLDLVDGLKLMHDKDIVHGDIKPHNIVLNGNIPIYIDFEMSCVLGSNEKFLNFRPKSRGTPNYMAPEFWKPEENIDLKKTDIYSLGCTFYFLCNEKRLPYKSNGVEELKNNVLSLDPISSSSGVKELDKLIMSMISKDINNRPTLSCVRDVIGALIDRFSDKEC